MRRLTTILIAVILWGNAVTAQEITPNIYQQYFNEAHQTYPAIPKGILEAVAYTKTRFNHLNTTNRVKSCTGLPLSYGVMGLVEDGENYFQNNLQRVANIAKVPTSAVKNDARTNILAYAKAYSELLKVFQNPTLLETQANVLQSLSELPDGTVGQNYALNCELYAIYWFLSQPKFQAAYNFPEYNIPWETIFGTKNYAILSSAYVTIDGETIANKEGVQYEINSAACTDYNNSTWVAAHSSNFSSRSGTPISAVTVHDIEGSYSGAISWFQNPSANVSAHYVLRSIDGQITQMVCEADKGWHVGSENPYAIGLEHEGYYNQTGWYTVAMYTASADLVKDICKDYNTIDNIRTAYWPWASTTHYNQSSIPGNCIRIKGHQHFPNQSHIDPGPNWDWDYYYKLINDSSTIDTLKADSGQFYDTGGPNSNYGDDERKLWLIQPPNATSLTLEVNSFNVEADWDYMYIYEGTSVFDTLLGAYTDSTIPSSITTPKGALLIEFRSDCGVNSNGWNFTWTSIPKNEDTTISKIAQSNSFLSTKIFPNPSSEGINIELQLQKSSEISISIFTTVGKLIYNSKVQVQAGKQIVAIPEAKLNLAQGIYFVELNNEGNKKVLEVVRQ